MERTELLIIGAGAAGISAACAAWDAGCRDIILTDRLPYPGGVLPQCLHEGFGLAAYGSELTGPAYAARLAERLAQTGVRFLPGREVLAVTKEKTADTSQRSPFYADFTGSGTTRTSPLYLSVMAGRQIWSGSLPV